jgi:hypothetical protein
MLCAGAAAVSAQELARPRPAASQSSDARPSASDVPVLTVCEVLANASAYKGRLVIVVGKYGSWMEGAALEGACDSTPGSIWLGYDASRELPPPSEVPDYLPYKARVIAKLPEQERVGVEMVVGCNYSGLWAAVFGRFETDDSRPVDRRTGERVGFGHMANWRTQLAYPSAGFWCLVPPDKREAVTREMRDREVRARVAAWRNLKTELQNPAGSAYFDASVKGRVIRAVQGVVVSTDAKEHPGVIEISVLDTFTPEARLVLDKPLNRPLEPGTKIQFDGVAAAFSPNPYRIVFEVTQAELDVGLEKH